jgi:hypothetical protein
MSPLSSVRVDGTPTKTNSLGRTRGTASRRGTGGLRRQSKHESGEVAESPVAVETSEVLKAENRGVQLEDKPMDFE